MTSACDSGAMNRWGVLALASLAVACSSSGNKPADGGADSAPPPGPIVVTTDKGVIEGSALESARSFLGIPYAAPPTGNLRWKPPADAPAWTGTKQAKAYGHACPQVDIATGKPVKDLVEDCLFLNVWTPLAAPSKPAPVMVFIHGGGFVVGSGSEQTYVGSTLASKGVVVVTLNYRLGVFGFLEHSLLAGEAGKSAAPSFGLLDQRAALAWVKRNIAAFGGDPGNVTIFGESAGGTSVCSHLAMAQSAGLFHRAIVESGPCGHIGFTTAAAGLAQGDDFAKAVGCTDLACMRAKSADEVAAALQVRPGLFGSPGVSWGPVVDGAELTTTPNELLASGGGAQVPVIAGTTKDEGDLFTLLWKLAFGADITDQQIADTLAVLYTPQQVQAILARYPGSQYPSTPARASALITDGLFVCSARQTVRAVAKNGRPAYLYQFAYPFRAPLYPTMGVAHSFELPFVFGTTFGGKNIGDDERPTSDAMQGYWSRFALAGDPNGRGAPAWPRYDAASDQHIVLDATITTGSNLKRDACDFWDTL